MVFGIIGENCSGKSTLAEKIMETLGGEIITGKDYLRMAKSEGEALSLFREKLRRAVSGDNIIYVIADSEHVELLPDGAVRILVTADLETIRNRFAARMHGTLPRTVALMLERRHGMFDSGEYDYRFDGAAGDANSFCEVLKSGTADREKAFTIRRLFEDERQAALDLAWVVFSEYESPDYSAEGTEEFRKCLHDVWTAGITGAESARECFGVCLKTTQRRRSPSILPHTVFPSIRRLGLCRPMKKRQ